MHSQKTDASVQNYCHLPNYGNSIFERKRGKENLTKYHFTKLTIIQNIYAKIFRNLISINWENVILLSQLKLKTTEKQFHWFKVGIEELDAFPNHAD